MIEHDSDGQTSGGTAAGRDPARAGFESLPSQAAVVDGQGRIVAVNEAWREFARRNGNPPAGSVGPGVDYLDVCERADPATEEGEAAARVAEGLRAVLRGERELFRTEYPCHAPDEHRWFLVTVAPLDDGEGAVVEHVNITERKSREDSWAYRALHDPLTDLPNRTLFLDRLERALARARREDRRSMAVLYLDLDGFKAVNDRHGHLAGDRLLMEAARRIEADLREADAVARMGGDEFVALLEMSGGRPEIRQAAERLAGQVGEPYEVDGVRVELTASVGVAPIEDPGVEPEEALRAADRAMYRAKRSGRRVAVAGEDGAAPDPAG